MTKWNNGPPPSCGWWPASIGKHSDYYRWWDGKYWSVAATRGCQASSAAALATINAEMGAEIYWKHRPKSWPARSFT